MASFDHIGVYVKDLERSLEFYCKILGFPEQTRFNVGDSKIIVLDIYNGYLELIQRPDVPSDAARGRRMHIAFHVKDYDDLESKLEKNGLELRKMTLNDGSRIAFFKDPDGHDIEIMERGL